ncbi:G-type lectin S-receptor-like serine/threonine-protein kinase At4g03230 [Corylus avellana]|uniref:G-type lectin S-receptor-like serine/threonine-protein kinase At4g03230 n=1 Tax=Corylus avellana TaxID=13451 RepID=UPI00286C485A|nr:G-type lectin S-receptor-like serine/threonine-protein kinase At4g03230 [Corylus avellana]
MENLQDRNPSKYLDWKMRVNIIWGIAHGLLYLHRDSRLRIIHRDLKPSNILLDDEMNPKITDFGLARIIEGKNTGSRTMRIVGTYGYVAPEYTQSGIFSVKSDVYSFGVVLLEIAWILWVKNKVLDLVAQTLREVCNADQFVKYINIGLLCVQDDPHDCPTMSNVVTMLGSEAATIPIPKQPTFFRGASLSNTTNLSTRPLKGTKSTISEIYDEVNNEREKRVGEKKSDEALELHLVLKYDKLYYNGLYLEE